MVSVVYFYSQQILTLFSIIEKNAWFWFQTAYMDPEFTSPMDTLQQYTKQFQVD